MAIAEVINLAALILKMLKAKSESSKEYFEDFVHPVWDAFVKVHEDYMSAFRTYAQQIEADNFDNRVLTKQMREDIFFSSSLRSELRQRVKHMPAKHLKVDQQYLLDFVQSMADYFDNRTYFTGQLPKGSAREKSAQLAQLAQLAQEVANQSVRTNMVKQLNRFPRQRQDSRADIRGDARELVEEYTKRQQIKFEQIADAFYYLKERLLQ